MADPRQTEAEAAHRHQAAWEAQLQQMFWPYTVVRSFHQQAESPYHPQSSFHHRQITPGSYNIAPGSFSSPQFHSPPHSSREGHLSMFDRVRAKLQKPNHSSDSFDESFASLPLNSSKESHEGTSSPNIKTSRIGNVPGNQSRHLKAFNAEGIQDQLQHNKRNIQALRSHFEATGRSLRNRVCNYERHVDNELDYLHGQMLRRRASPVSHEGSLELHPWVEDSDVDSGGSDSWETDEESDWSVDDDGENSRDDSVTPKPELGADKKPLKTAKDPLAGILKFACVNGAVVDVEVDFYTSLDILCTLLNKTTDTLAKSTLYDAVQRQTSLWAKVNGKEDETKSGSANETVPGKEVEKKGGYMALE